MIDIEIVVDSIKIKQFKSNILKHLLVKTRLMYYQINTTKLCLATISGEALVFYFHSVFVVLLVIEVASTA